MSHIAEVHQSQDTMARMMAEATVMTSMTWPEEEELEKVHNNNELKSSLA